LLAPTGEGETFSNDIEGVDSNGTKGSAYVPGSAQFWAYPEITVACPAARAGSNIAIQRIVS
jgi:hypothetical protein